MKNTFASLSLSLLFIFSLFTGSCKKTSNGSATLASFTITVDGLTITCNNASTGATSYIWNFGDGKISSAASPLHTYAAAGTYNVSLTASGNGSSTVSQTVTVTVVNTNPGNGGAVGIVSYWITNTNQSQLLQKQPASLTFAAGTSGNTTITVDSTQRFQDIDGFGFCLTGGSAQVINAMGASQKAALLNELFGTGDNTIGISYLRVSIGASDLNAAPFSYDDVSSGQTDPSLAGFSLNADQAGGGTGVIPLLNEILAINPNIKILATPWSAPVWMKTTNSFSGGSLNTAYYGAYAQYFVKYIQQMKAQGITIDAVTPQNEPENSNNNPAMTFTAQQETNFIKNNLGPALQTAGLTTKIIAYDHNCDDTQFPLTVLGDATANSYVNGSAFHLYAGDISALGTVHNAYPNKAVYFTEFWEQAGNTLSDDLEPYTERIVVGSMRNWSRATVLWNLANNASFGPFTSGGCSQCMGALTISGSTVTRNPAYYIIGHASKFAVAGSVRIATNAPSNLPNVAFLTPQGQKVLIVTNKASGPQTFNIQFNGKIITSNLQGNSVGTYTWQ